MSWLRKAIIKEQFTQKLKMKSSHHLFTSMLMEMLSDVLQSTNNSGAWRQNSGAVFSLRSEVDGDLQDVNM